MQLTKWIGPPALSPWAMPPSAPPPPPPISRESFAALYRDHVDLIRHLARRAGAPSGYEDDVVQQVFLALHRAIGRGLDLTEPLHGWLRQTTYRYARNCRRLAHCRSELLTREGEIEARYEGPSPETNVVMNQVARIVLELLDELPHDQRMVLAMSDLEDMPMSEIASVLEIP
jgi:RNA polymerase sigma-70 factor (ECF subfamily)